MISKRLKQRAEISIEYWTGTMHARILERDIEANDEEALKYHLVIAEHEMQLQEDYNLWQEHLNQEMAK